MAAGTLSLVVDADVDIPSRGFDMPGRLAVPERARGVVVFAHDAECDARTPGDRHVAHLLHELGIGTLLFDLLAGDEAARSTFDIDVLAVRLLLAGRWLRAHAPVTDQPIGYLGVRRGGDVALLAATERSADAVVVRGAPLRVDAAALAAVQVPTLFVVPGADRSAREAGRRAVSEMTCTSELAVVPRAADGFTEPGALEASARVAGAWFLRHLQQFNRDEAR